MAGTPPAVPGGTAGTALSTVLSRTLEDTLDPLQKKFHCTKRELYVWRQSLLYRYRNHLPSNVTLSVESRDFNECAINTNDSDLPNFHGPYNTQLAKTAFRLSLNDQQFLVITLYLRKSNDDEGTFLAQGAGCPTFAVDEVNRLAAFVQYVTSLLHTPSSDNSDSSSAATDLYNKLCNIPLSAVSDDAADPDVPDVTSSDCQNNHVSKADMWADCMDTKLVPDTTCDSVKRSYNRRVSNRYIMIRHSPSNLVSPMEDLEDLYNHFTTEINDARTQLKNEFKNHSSTRLDSLENELATVRSRLEKVEKENQKLKSDAGEYKKTISVLQQKLDTITESVNTGPHHQCHFPPLTRQYPPQASCPPPSFSAVAQTQNAPTGQPKPAGNPIPYLPLQSQSPVSATPPQTVQVSNQTHHLNASPSFTPQYHVPIRNRFDALAENPSSSVASTEQKAQDISVRVTSGNDAGNNLARSPAEILSLAELQETTDYLIIGDSVIRSIHPGKMNTGEYSRVQKICVPGMVSTDLIEWLDSQSPKPHVCRVVVHVGVNDCKGEEVSAERWSQLLAKLKNVFPFATILASSILPARGRHLMNPAITTSNQNLQSVCSRLGIKFVNNRNTFLAKSNAPKKELYADPLHPSMKGTLKLARNIKYPDQDFGASNGGNQQEYSRAPNTVGLQQLDSRYFSDVNHRLQQTVDPGCDVNRQQAYTQPPVSAAGVLPQGGIRPTTDYQYLPFTSSLSTQDQQTVDPGCVNRQQSYAQPPVSTADPVNSTAHPYHRPAPVVYPPIHSADLQTPSGSVSTLDAVTQAVRLLQGIFLPA